MTTKAVDRMLEQILSIDWAYNPEHEGSHVLLLQEHFRRMVINTKRLNESNIFITGDLGDALNPQARAPEEHIQHLRQHLLNRTWPAFVHVLEYALHWAVARYTPEAHVLKDHPDPYKPILVMYERGGTFAFDHKTDTYQLSMNFDGAAIPKQPWWKWNRRQPFIRLDGNALDEADMDWYDFLDDQDADDESDD